MNMNINVTAGHAEERIKIRIEHVLVCLLQSGMAEWRANTCGFGFCFTPLERTGVKQKPENCQCLQAIGGGERSVA